MGPPPAGASTRVKEKLTSFCGRVFPCADASQNRLLLRCCTAPTSPGIHTSRAPLAIWQPVRRDFDDDQRAIWEEAVRNAPPGMLRRLDSSVLEVWTIAVSLQRRALAELAEQPDGLGGPAAKRLLIVIRGAGRRSFGAPRNWVSPLRAAARVSFRHDMAARAGRHHGRRAARDD